MARRPAAIVATAAATAAAAAMSRPPWEILLGDVRTVLKKMPSNSAHGCCCDPPYGISFMGKRWDYDVPSVGTWVELLRVLRPGAHALIFGGPRTFHRVACGVEDAGFEIRDVLMWVFASGFPKSLDVSKALDKDAGKPRPVIGVAGKSGAQRGCMAGDFAGGEYMETAPVTAAAAAAAWDGYGTALKPAYEPILLVRKPLDGTVAENALRWGTGGIAIDACRVPYRNEEDAAAAAAAAQRLVISPVDPHVMMTGRGPHLEGSLDVWKGKQAQGRWPSDVVLDEESAQLFDRGALETTDQPSRFFFTAKAGRYEREAGLHEAGLHEAVVGSLQGGGPNAADPVSQRFTKKARNTHTTVKPIDLIRYIAALILPAKTEEPRQVLVPFAGSGSEMIGCMQAGWDEVVGIEREAAYIEIAKGRIRKGGVFSKLADR